MGPVEKGPESVEAARQQLQGTWSLLYAETTKADGQPVTVRATGTLTCDAHGNMTATGEVLDKEMEVPASLIAFNGPAVIDARARRLWIASPTAAPQPHAEAYRPDNAKYYEFENDLLRFALKDANGKTTARAVYRKRVEK